MASRALEQLVDRIAHTEVLDQVARPLSQKVAEVLGDRRLKDILSGTWLGHPLHPMLTDLPIGFWTSAMALDVLGGRRGRKGADRLVALGVLSALPTAISGMSDWSDTIGEDRRVGLAHAAGNTLAVALYGWSWTARARGRRAKGVAIGFLAAASATAGAYLGGHLAWRRGVNVDRHAFEHPPGGWVEAELAPDAALALDAGEAVVVRAGEATVLLVHHDGRLQAISDTCGHAGGPLHQGQIDAGCVTCPWHGSVFRLDDGEVVHGPATAPQPAYDVRREGRRVMVRSRRLLALPGAASGDGQESWPTSSSTPSTGARQE